MIVLWIVIVMLSLLTAVGGALIALRIQYWVIDRTRQEREAWQQAQESRQRIWEVRQGKHMLEIERRLSEQVKDVRKDFCVWSQEVENDQQILQRRLTIEQELARLPHIEDVELPVSQQGPYQPPDRWQPPALYGADLRGRDLSHRYMGRADLRTATLTEANLYMADLSGASLTGANLERANLVGANLSEADLREANLSGAYLLVSDLHKAVLHGAVLQNVHNLTLEQLQAALYDSTTAIDSSLTTIVSADSPGEKQERLANENEEQDAALRTAIPESTAPATLEAESQDYDGKYARQSEESAEGETLPMRKIIRLEARTSKASPVSSPGNKRQTRETNSRSKRKGAGRSSKISSISQKKDKQFRAN